MTPNIMKRLSCSALPALLAVGGRSTTPHGGFSVMANQLYHGDVSASPYDLDL
ncbi:hypothetical protein ACWD3J_47585 [Streptomyces sp. NPDC002755]